jgi:hypothetical protein
MGSRKEIFIKIYYFHVLTTLLGQQFHADSKTDLKMFHTIHVLVLEGHKFFD